MTDQNVSHNTQAHIGHVFFVRNWADFAEKKLQSFSFGSETVTALEIA